MKESAVSIARMVYFFKKIYIFLDCIPQPVLGSQTEGSCVLFLFPINGKSGIVTRLPQTCFIPSNVHCQVEGESFPPFGCTLFFSHLGLWSSHTTWEFIQITVSVQSFLGLSYLGGPINYDKFTLKGF